MNLYKVFDQLFNRQEKAIARVIEQRAGGQVTARTEAGAIVILTGDMEVGKKCYYDRRTGDILGEAPDVTYSEYGV